MSLIEHRTNLISEKIIGAAIDTGTWVPVFWNPAMRPVDCLPIEYKGVHVVSEESSADRWLLEAFGSSVLCGKNVSADPSHGLGSDTS